MAVNKNNKHGFSPVLVIGATSFAIVAGVGAARYALADQHSQSPSLSSQAVSTSSPESSADVHSEVSATTEPVQPTDAVDTQTDSTRDDTAHTSHASVTVNGQTYSVTDNGQLNTTQVDNNGQTSINISVQSSGNDQQYSSASSNVHVFSKSSVNQQSTGGTTP